GQFDLSNSRLAVVALRSYRGVHAVFRRFRLLPTSLGVAGAELRYLEFEAAVERYAQHLGVPIWWFNTAWHDSASRSAGRPRYHGVHFGARIGGRALCGAHCGICPAHLDLAIRVEHIFGDQWDYNLHRRLRAALRRSGAETANTRLFGSVRSRAGVCVQALQSS